MVLIDGVKYACQRCVRGHRVTTCTHTDQPLTMIKPKGRPSTTCIHCRSLRLNKNINPSGKCSCGKNLKPPKNKRRRNRNSFTPLDPTFTSGPDGDTPTLRSPTSCGCNNSSQPQLCKCYAMRRERLIRRDSAISILSSTNTSPLSTVNSDLLDTFSIKDSSLSLVDLLLNSDVSSIPGNNDSTKQLPNFNNNERVSRSPSITYESTKNIISNAGVLSLNSNFIDVFSTTESTNNNIIVDNNLVSLLFDSNNLDYDLPKNPNPPIELEIPQNPDNFDLNNLNDIGVNFNWDFLGMELQNESLK